MICRDPTLCLGDLVWASVGQEAGFIFLKVSDMDLDIRSLMILLSGLVEVGRPLSPWEVEGCAINSNAFPAPPEAWQRCPSSERFFQ